MFARLVYFVVFIAACSCAPDTSVNGIFYRLYGKEVTNFKDFPLKNGVDMLNETIYDKKIITKIYIDSWLEKPNSYDGRKLIEAALTTWNANLVIFDWSNINKASKSSYESVAAQVKKVGTALGKQLCEMIAAGLEPEKIEIIGLALGANVAGEAGRTVQTTCKHKIRRIVGLDPALWKFLNCLETTCYRLINSHDATQTTIIHTTNYIPNSLRMASSIGTLDFHVNRYPFHQPGCSTVRPCDQVRSYDLYVESILHPKSLLAMEDIYSLSCDNDDDWDTEDRVPISIGDDTTTTKGIYYLSTNSTSPYGKGEEGYCP